MLQYLAAFGGGMLSFLSPCVLPLVPGYLSLMSGVTYAELQTPDGADTRRLLRSTLLFVLGFTIVFTAIGAVATGLGQALIRNQRELRFVAGIVVILMGIFLAGFVSPRFLQRERRFHIDPGRLGAFAPPLMGMAFAFGWTPCIGPVLGTVLSAAATTDTLARGIALLVAYSLGLGVPFVLAGVAFGRLTGVFGWVKRHYRVINVTAGVLLVGFGLLLATNRVTRLASALINFLDSVGLDFLTEI